MTGTRVVAAMAHGSPADEWARRVATTLDATFVLVLDDPVESTAPAYADSTLVSSQRLGFGSARRTAMVLAAEFGDTCLVVDGDGQHPPAALARIFDRLEETGADVVVPQRRTRTVWLDRDGERIDRRPFERLEALCAWAAADVNATPDPSFDCQPGAFGFRSAAVGDLLPTDDAWLADWEITVRALESNEYATVDIPTVDEAQDDTTFGWADQQRKLERIDDSLEEGIRSVYDRHRGVFSTAEQETLERALEAIR